jgi:hypothetical protein
MPASRHRRKGKLRHRVTSARQPVIWGSARAHDILNACEALIVNRLNETVGHTRPWTDQDYRDAVKHLREEGILDSGEVLAELAPEMEVISD